MAANNQPVKPKAPKKDARRAVFTVLWAVLRIYKDDFVLKADKPNHGCLETRSSSLNGRRLFFAAAVSGGAHVAGERKW